jgi:cobalt/nickel transport system permease protein
MHLGNGAITPECGLFALGAAATGTVVALAVARSKPLDRNTTYTAAALGAAVIAAQMFNVQIVPFSSVHLIGGVLLAWTLGPPLGLLMMAAILGLEAALLGDGGLLALGVNVINMGLVPALFVAAARRLTSRGRSLRAGIVLAATAMLATIAAAGLVTIEVAIGRNAGQLEGWRPFAGQMLASHALFGVAEAAATVAIVGLLGGLRRPAGAPLKLPRAWSGGIAGTAIMIAILSAPQFGLASGAPDGYETAVARAHEAGSPLGNLESASQAGKLNAKVQAWQDRLVAQMPTSEPLRGAIGTLVAGAIAFGLASFAVGSGWCRGQSRGSSGSLSA